MKSHFVYSLLLGLLLANSCKSDPNPKEKIKVIEKKQVTFSYQIASKGDTLAYHQVVQYKTENDSLYSDSSDIAQIVFSFPVIDSFSTPNTKDSINLLIKNILLQSDRGDMAFASIENRLNEFILDFLDFNAEMQEFGLPSGPKWVNDLEIKILLNSPQWLCLKVYEEEFTGGAHPQVSFRFFNINLETAQIITLQDLFVGEYKPTLDSIALLAFNKVLLSQQDSSLTHFELDSNKFPLPENFSLESNHIGFHYNPYEITPYSLGTINFNIPYSTIFSILNKDFIKLDTITTEITAIDR